MVVASIILLAALVIAASLSIHFGPHGLVASGVVGGVMALAFAITTFFLVNLTAQVLSLGILLAMLAMSLGVIYLGIRGIKMSKRLASSSVSTKLLQSQGVAVTDLNPVGTVRILGETWSAESLSGHVKAGVEVYVSEIDGLRLKVWANPKLSQTTEQEHGT